MAAAILVIAQKTAKVPDNEIHKATAVPDRIILNWAGDPATTIAVNWRSTSAGGFAEIALAEDGPGHPKKARKVDAVSEDFVTDAGPARAHFVHIDGLRADTPYVYRVGDGMNWSEWNQFRTASDSASAPVEFVYVGDAQNDIYSMWSRVIRQAYGDAPKARFIIHAGDLVNRGIVDYEWGEWFAAAGWINRSIVSLPTPGNHEYPADAQKVRHFTGHWRKQFALPSNGVKGLEESNYYVDVQGVRLISLNSNERQKEQGEWLDALLSAPNRPRWTILTFHHPIYSPAIKRDNKVLREMWQPILDKHRVDMVLTGHDHTYGRSNLMTGKTGMKGGTMYVVSVSGPKQYELERENWMARAAADTQLYQVIRVDPAKIRFEARTARGGLYDAFELRKGKPNRLVNLIPKTPERLAAPAK